MKNNRKSFKQLAAVMLLAFVFTTIPAWAVLIDSDKRIVVIADPHVMSPELLKDPDNVDWLAYINADRKMIDMSRVLFDQAIEDIEFTSPDLVLIVGDLTKDGEKASHNYVKSKLYELKNNYGIQSLIIPGNHDFGTAGAKIYDVQTTSPAETITRNEFVTLYEDYGYGNNSGSNYERLENTLTYACEPIPGLVVIGVDTGTDGVLSETTLNWVCAKAATSRANDKQVIVMMHHPLIPHITGGEAFSETISVANYETVRNRLADSGVCAVFTGHFHTSDIAMDWNAYKTKPIYDVNTGSLCSYPCDYRVVTFKNGNLNYMSITTNTATGASTITADAAKTRLKTSITNLIAAKLTAANYNAFIVQMIAPSLADAYVYHAEGDENSNADAQTLLTSLNTLLSSAPTYQNLVNSMLLNKSNYGDTVRENQTNDRELKIDSYSFISGNCGQTGTDGSDVTWSYDASSKTLTISGTGAMMYYGLTNDYLHSTSPWSHFDDELEHVVIENGVTSVGAYAFAMCGHLTSVSLPASVFQIDQAAFYNSNLVRIDIPRIETVSLAQYAFDFCPEGLSIVVPSTLLKTYKDAANWSTYADKLVGSLSEATGFNTTTFVTGKYEFKRTFRCGVSSTICLPFGITAAQAASVGKFYSFEGVDKSGEWTVIMREDVNEVKDGLNAYKPYLFVPFIFDGMSFGDEFEFTFSGSVSSLDIAGSVNKEESKYYGSFWSFQGVFYDILWDETHNSDKLGKVYGFAARSYDGGSYTVNPGDFVKAGAGASIAPFRAYLQYTFSNSQGAPMRGGIRSDEPLPNSMKVKLINVDGYVTAVGEIDMETGDVIIDIWSDMNGRILPGEPVDGGMYIHNGKQVLIKY